MKKTFILNIKKTKPFFLFVLISIMISCKSNVMDLTVTSPSDSLRINVAMSSEKEAYFNAEINGVKVLNNSKLGVSLNNLEFSNELAIIGTTGPTKIEDQYELIHGKKKQIIYRANEKIFHLENSQGKKMDIIFRVSNDGFAFRYHFPENPDSMYVIEEEKTTFQFPENTTSWLQPMSPSKSGWSETNPSYEEHYLENIPVGTVSPLGSGWVYPALFKTGENWVLITETGLDRNYCGTRLRTIPDTHSVKIDFPEKKEIFPGGMLLPSSYEPFYSPWRVVTVGSLQTIVESTLGTDLADPAIKMETDWIKPGYASWSWAILKDNSIKYDIQKEFIDYAAEMNWQYCLVDVNWDTTIGYEKIAELSQYAQSKNVGLILWYNSSGDWNSTEYHPKSKLLTHEDRIAEFTKLKNMGIKGIKVDFFGGDGQSVIAYYHDIFKDAADFDLMVNCHGSTLPRGWQRTYPNLVTMEAIKGFEFITFEQQNADRAPGHCALLPFTRNAFDPMDFTPMCLHEIPGIERKTTNGFELALPVLFLSGVQHLAETPEGMETVPDYVKEYLQHLPTQWEDVQFIDGFPGKEVMLARKAGNEWYIVGINGEQKTKSLSLDLSEFGKKGTLITDADSSRLFKTSELDLSKEVKLDLMPAGGFVIKAIN